MENNFSIPKSALLKEIVYSFWQVHRPNNLPMNETIIPKGIIEIIFSFETQKIHGQINNKQISVPRCFVHGHNSCPVHLHIADQQTFFGVILHPTAVKHILKIPPVEFVNCIIDLTIIDVSFYKLWHNLGEQKNFNNRVSFFTNWLINRLPVLTDREKAFNYFLNNHSNTSLTVSELTKRFCYSSKQLTRKLYEITGMNTEQTLLYKKYLHSIHLIHNSELSLTEIAYICQFYDQSHFIKTFRSLTLLTPKEYKQGKSNIIGHILENVS